MVVLVLAGLIFGNVSAPRYGVLLLLTITTELSALILYVVSVRGFGTLGRITFGILAAVAILMLLNAIYRVSRMVL